MSFAAGRELVEPLPGARIVETARRVRLGDVSPSGRLRLDAAVRYLQDVSDDDTRDAYVDDAGWVVRRTVLDVHSFPAYGQMLELRTWCAGLGGRWAERRVSITGADSRIEASTLWVHVDPETGRAVPLTKSFLDLYAPSAGGRTISARLHIGEPPAAGRVLSWPVRFTDFDALGHVNNAAAWAAVEEHLSPRRDLRGAIAATLEHRHPLERSDLDGSGAVQCTVDDSDARLAVWLRGVGGKVAVAAEVRRLSP